MKNRIAQFRKKQRYSQVQLAEAAHVTRQTINAIENGKYDPSLGHAFHLAQILRVRLTNYSYMKARIKMINTKKNIIYGTFSYCYLDWQENRVNYEL